MDDTKIIDRLVSPEPRAELADITTCVRALAARFAELGAREGL